MGKFGDWLKKTVRGQNVVGKVLGWATGTRAIQAAGNAIQKAIANKNQPASQPEPVQQIPGPYTPNMTLAMQQEY